MIAMEISKQGGVGAQERCLVLNKMIKEYIIWKVTSEQSLKYSEEANHDTRQRDYRIKSLRQEHASVFKEKRGQCSWGKVGKGKSDRKEVREVRE